MILIGDIHCEFYEYRTMLQTFGDHPTIQLGDMGIGFGHDGEYGAPPHHRFIRGNHDNPQKCRAIPNYLGDFGYLEDEGIFFVSGAASPDFYQRVPHVNWWEDEELNHGQAAQALALYKEKKPKIVATHDCPLFLLSGFYGPSQEITTSTGRLLDAMFEAHEPSAWLFAHHHKSLLFNVRGTRFFGLRILEAVKLTEERTHVDYLGEAECES